MGKRLFFYTRCRVIDSEESIANYITAFAIICWFDSIDNKTIRNIFRNF